MKLYITLAIILTSLYTKAQDTTQYILRFNIPVVDMPQNKDLSYRYPSMQQAFEWGNAFYDAGFYGINALNHKIFPQKKVLNKISNYAMGLGFSYYGSELPIPLGVWTHEEFHRSVLGINGLHPKNGNWFMTRWDGTVFGMSDRELTSLKQDHPDQLLHSYVAGVQSETLFTKENVIRDFFYERTQYKTSFYLYNAYYVWNYFRFSASGESDSVKMKAPEFESSDPRQRDYAGADLTAWTYDMFSPSQPYTQRDAFPGGEGVNRRIGYSDLSEEAQRFLTNQKKLALINFFNPAIFFVNRIRFGDHYSMMAFPSYVPTNFGNAISLYVPMKVNNSNILAGISRYANQSTISYGVEAGYYDWKLSDKIHVDGKLIVWTQPEHQSYFDITKRTGGALEVTGRYALSDSFQIYTMVSSKTAGWYIGNPFLDSNTSVRLGMSCRFRQK